MRIFSLLYTKVMSWAEHPNAQYYLAILSFAESSFFPVPPDVMLAPMTLAQPHRAWYYAALTTISSVIGGLIGYFLGMSAFTLIKPILVHLGYWQSYLEVVSWSHQWGFWVMFLAGCAPIPYKLFTISAGVVGMHLVPFIIASIIGRGGRFFLVAALMVWGGDRMEQALRKYVDFIGWALLILCVVAYIGYELWHYGT